MFDPQAAFLSIAADMGVVRRPPAPPAAALSAVEWIERNFRVYDTGQLLTLHERQRLPLELALERDATSAFRFSTVLWSWPKKSAKSTVIASVALERMARQPRASVKLIANDLNQADSRVGYYLRESIKQHPDMRAQARISPSLYKIAFSNGSFCEMLPIDPEGEAGANDDLIVYSELHGWRSEKHKRMWAEMTLSPTKAGRAQRWIDTYAGYVGASPVLEMLYQLGMEGQRWREGWEVWINERAKLLMVWVTEHHLPWQTSEAGRAYYAEQASTLPPSEFDRMHRNQWVSSVEAFVPVAWWDACQDDAPPLDRYRELAVGIDAATSGDCFAIVAVSREGDTIRERAHRAWTPQAGQKLLYANPADPNDPDYPEGYLRWLAREFNVVVFNYDPYQLHDMATRLLLENVGWFREFGQSAPRLVADKQLYDLIRERRLRHDGDTQLRQHVANADRKAEGERLRIVKRAEHLKIDLAVALSMAAAGAMEYLTP